MSLNSLHQASVLDFVNPVGFGFVKDRRHVAGFQEHQMSQEPAAADGWFLETIDLIGLVVHDEPMAYLSENLPRMDELREAPTQLLDQFEADGLAAMRSGDDLYVRDTMTGRRRALGRIRAVKQCIACHGGSTWAG